MEVKVKPDRTSKDEKHDKFVEKEKQKRREKEKQETSRKTQQVKSSKPASTAKKSTQPSCESVNNHESRDQDRDCEKKFQP